MTRSTDETFSAGLQAGRLEGADIPDLLWALCRGHQTGVLHFQRKDARTSLYLDAGKIVFAASNVRDDRLGELLLRLGRITLADLERAIAEFHTGKRIGTLLVEAGALTPEHLVDGVLGQVRKIVLGLFAWEDGEYHFEAGPLPSDEVIKLSMSTGELLLSGIRSIRSFARIRRSVGTPRTMYRLREGWRDALEGVRLSEGEELLVVRLEQADESVEGLCREVFLSNFEIYQTLWGLKVLGVVEKKISLAESGDAEWQGSLAELAFADVLVGVAQRGATGILHVSHRMKERTFHFSDGRCVFATSNDTDDGLIAYLLRRGVISLNDREETAKRLLSNKRVGTILRELGVIDDRDLEEMVRQQLSEVVFDTFCWDDGDFAFYEGALPSNEEITLSVSIEGLVAEGIRRVGSWSKVLAGCGGMDHRLWLSERYLDVLDGLDAGAEEWQVVNALKQSQPAREIASAVDLPDFRVCQILWTLRVLGALELRSLEEQIIEEREPAQSIPVDIVDLDRPIVEPAAEEEPVTVHVESAAPEVQEADEEEIVEDVVEEQFEERVETPPETPLAVEIAEDETVSTRIEVEFVENGQDQELGRDDIDAADRNHEMQHDEVAVEAAHPHSDDDHLRELEESTRTIRLSREEIDSALNASRESAKEGLAEIEDPWEPPEDLEHSISRFNAMQRLVYRTVRAEVGAGAANFIRACCDEGSLNPVEDTELHSDGSWDSDGLRRRVLEHRIEDPWELYRQLIGRELDVLRSHIGEARIMELQRRVDEVNKTHAP